MLSHKQTHKQTHKMVRRALRRAPWDKKWRGPWFSLPAFIPHVHYISISGTLSD